jgi:hypothetical protein
MSDQQERPDLNRRRRPQPAPDERVDPVDYRQAASPAPVETTTAVAAKQKSAVAAKQTSAVAAPAQRGRPRREVTVPFSTRLSPDVFDLIDAAVASGVDGTTIRAVLEAAIREKYGKI